MRGVLPNAPIRKEAMRNPCCDSHASTGYLLTRIEALEQTAIRNQAVSAGELRDARAQAEKKLEPHLRWLGSPLFDKDFERALSDTLGRLKGGL
jgi:hypothetical protein